MKCPYCNKRINKTSNRCPHCQRLVDTTNAEVFEIEDDATKPIKKDNFFKRVFMSYITFWKKYIDYKSTTSVLEFWSAYTINAVVCCILSVYWWLVIPYSIAMLVPMFTLIMRRFNDVGFPLVYMCVGLIPCGVLALLIMCSLPKDFYRKRTDFYD